MGQINNQIGLFQANNVKEIAVSSEGKAMVKQDMFVTSCAGQVGLALSLNK